MVGDAARQPPPEHEPARGQRVIILGASNVTRSLGTAVAAIQARWNAPLEIVIAAGHGRSYGMWSSVLGRWLPGIAQCQLWRDIERQPSTPTAAIVTDIGNDLMYGAAVEQIVGWVEACLARLARAEAEMVVTRLPLFSVAAISPGKFRIFQRVLFPGSAVTLAQIADRARTLDERIARLAQSHGASLAAPDAAWYGWDPIHIRRRSRRDSWRAFLDAWPMIADERAFTSRVRAFRLRIAAPCERRFGRFTQRRAQPALQFGRAMRVSFY